MKKAFFYPGRKHHKRGGIMPEFYVQKVQQELPLVVVFNYGRNKGFYFFPHLDIVHYEPVTVGLVYYGVKGAV